MFGQRTIGTRASRTGGRAAPRATGSRRRRGMASVLAMLYLVLFSVLAIGFYAGTTMSVQVSRNEQRMSEAQVAAESQLDWGRRQMIRWNVTPGGSASATATAIYNSATTALAGTSNMNGHDPTQGTDQSGNPAVFIPGATGAGYPYTWNWMPLGANGAVGRLVISVTSSNVVIKAVGMAGNGSGGASTSANAPVRAAQFSYALQAVTYTPPAPGILSHGPLSLSNGAVVAGGSVTSATASGKVPITLSGGATIKQNFAYTANTKAPSLSNGGAINGTTTANVTAPAFPTVNSALFAAFVPAAGSPQGPKVITSTSTLSSGQVFTNIRVKANANVTFQNNEVLNGVIYVESPNNITFASCTINGIVVTDGNYGTPLSGNTLTFNNGVPIYGVETLNPSNFPGSENIATLKTLSGALVLAPNFQAVFAGGSKSYGDSLVASQFNMSNGYSGTINGAVIMLDDTSFQMMGGGTLTFAAGSSTIAGLSGSSRFAIDYTTYAEVSP